MTRTRSDDRRALDLVAACVTLDIPQLNTIVNEAADAGHLGHLVFGVFEVLEDLLDKLPRPGVVALATQVAAIATDKLVVDVPGIAPDQVRVAAKMSVAHAIHDDAALAALLDKPRSVTLLLDAIIGLHLHLLPALGDVEVLRALQAAALNAAIDESFGE